MASRPPPRFVVRRHDDTSLRRRRLWLGAGWLASLLLTALVVGTLAWRTTPAATDRRELKQLTAQNEDLKQQVANLQRSQQVGEIATKSLRGSLAEREEEISGLRTDLGFYARLVGGDAQRQGLKVQEVRLQPVAGSHGWDLTLSLTQNARRGDEIAGKLTLAVEGLRANKVVQLDWPALGDAAQKDGLPFRFKYFQQLHATFVLPADFQPTRLRIHAQADGAEAADRTVAWQDALGDATTTTNQGT
ncbi:hypothetical protein ASG87_17870 [Frateuria sp. Soil773]|uniref:DUF6776 family protein n=1 Tax=Frateuria sp. Soil773 TaxID=1736407 RepID=UPI0006F453B0|nr:DUF6776 family protein [Frateuria sp. Soil773]KRE94469.1 hypothetical protein ASG87_17870 [Frateuria sp. Soil773]